MRPASNDAPRLPIDPDLVGDEDLEHRGLPLQERRRNRAVQFVTVVAVGIGGIGGAVARYALSLAIPSSTNGFPWATFVINISGSAVLGLLLVLLIEQFPRGRLARPAIGTGVIGAYTTFSTWMVEADLLVKDGHPATAALYVVASALVGLLAVWAGMTLARALIVVERWLQGQH